jgi:hypothetical protein
MRVLLSYGLCSKDTWPYNKSEESDQPPQEAYSEAQQHQIHMPAQISGHIRSILKDSLAQGQPFVVGKALYSEFMSNRVRDMGVVPMPDSGSKLQGLSLGYVCWI